MSDLLNVCRKTLEEEADMLGTPDHCTINRAMELITSAYAMGYQQSSEQELREKYAGLALQGMIITSDMSILEHKGKAARNAVEFADALIKELRKEENQ